MKIKFSSVIDFIEELKKDKDKIERGIVRVNFERAGTQFSPNIWNVFLRAECIIAGNIVELRSFCGDLWGHGSMSDDRTKRTFDDKRKQLEEELAGMGITDIRGGAIEDEGA